jgi:hypothetical protein
MEKQNIMLKEYERVTGRAYRRVRSYYVCSLRDDREQPLCKRNAHTFIAVRKE